MSLLEAEFAKTIEYFVSTWQASSIEHKKIESEDEHYEKQSDWDGVQVMEKVRRSPGTLVRTSVFLDAFNRTIE
jgi:hypothetical protein